MFSFNLVYGNCAVFILLLGTVTIDNLIMN
jgi:hypothetical protein